MTPPTTGPTTTPATTPATARYGQLTYTSSDSGGGRGGWRVQDSSGDLSPTEIEALTRRIVPRFTPVHPVPDYPDEQQKAALPRRLVHAALPELAPAIAHWHTAPSGTDAHGRPGNVFVHVLLDRAPTGSADAASDDRRPTDLAGSPCWLRPFGAEAADLGAVPDPPWAPAVDRRAVLDFVFGPAAPAPAALCLLLDALDAGWGGGPVVLGLADMRTAALWVACVSHLMGARTARAFHWSTYERVADHRAWPRDLDLVVVPSADLADHRAGIEDLTVVRDDEEAPRGRLGEHRRTLSGASLPVSPWSVLVYEVLTERRPAEAVLAAMDAVAAEVGADASDPAALHPAWPLALAVARRPAAGQAVAGHAVAAARAVLETHCPPHLPTHHPQRYAEILALAESSVPDGVRGAREALRTCPHGTRHAILRDLWLRRALDADELPDPGSLDDLADVTDPRPVAAEILDRLRTSARGLADRLDPARSIADRARAVRSMLGLVEVLSAAGVVPDPGPDGGVAAAAAAEDWDRVWDRALAVLADPTARSGLLGDRPDALGPTVREPLTRAASRRLGPGAGRPGTRLPAIVLSLLSIRLPRADELPAVGGPDELQRELAALQTLVDPDPQATAWLVVVWELLGRGDRMSGPELTELDRLMTLDRPLRPDHLLALVRHRDHPALAEAVRRTLLAGPSGAPMTALAREVLTDPATGRAFADPSTPPALAARLRLLAGEPGTGQGGGQGGGQAAGRGRMARDRRELLTAARVALAGVDHRSVEPVVWQAVLVAHVLDTLIAGPHVRHGGARTRGDGGEAGDGGDPGGSVGSRLTPAAIRAGVAAQAARPGARTALVAALAAAPDLAGPTLVHSALELHLPPGDGPVHPAVLLGPLLTGPDGTVSGGAGPVGTALDDAVRVRRDAGGVGEDDLVEATQRLRRDRRGRDVETSAREWWDGRIPLGTAPASTTAATSVTAPTAQAIGTAGGR